MSNVIVSGCIIYYCRVICTLIVFLLSDTLMKVTGVTEIVGEKQYYVQLYKYQLDATITMLSAGA